MKNSQAPKRPAWDGKRHFKLLIILLAIWVGLFVIVLLEHGRSWARLLPVLFVGIVIYGAFATRRLIIDSKQRRE